MSRHRQNTPDLDDERRFEELAAKMRSSAPLMTGDRIRSVHRARSRRNVTVLALIAVLPVLAAVGIMWERRDTQPVTVGSPSRVVAFAAEALPADWGIREVDGWHVAVPVDWEIEELAPGCGAESVWWAHAPTAPDSASSLRPTACSTREPSVPGVLFARWKRRPTETVAPETTATTGASGASDEVVIAEGYTAAGWQRAQSTGPEDDTTQSVRSLLTGPSSVGSPSAGQRLPSLHAAQPAPGAPQLPSLVPGVPPGFMLTSVEGSDEVATYRLVENGGGSIRGRFVTVCLAGSSVASQEGCAEPAKEVRYGTKVVLGSHVWRCGDPLTCVADDVVIGGRSYRMVIEADRGMLDVAQVEEFLAFQPR